MLEMSKGALPVLLRVTVCAVLEVCTGSLLKASLVGEMGSMGAMPVPERLTIWGMPLTVTLTEAVRLPLAKGVNVTLMVQWLSAASELPHV
jgi:hypothetical protein